MAGFFCASAWGAGRCLLRIISPLATEPEHEAAAFALGAGTWGLTLFMLGRFGLFQPAAAWATAVAAAAAAWPAWRRAGRGARPNRSQTLSWGRVLAACVLALAAWHVLVHALAPPIDADALAYHLALPKLYLRAGEIRTISWLIFSHWPHLVSLLFALPLSLGLDNAAALLHVGAGTALIASVFLIAREEFDAPTAWTAAAVLAVQPVLTRYVGAPRIEAWWALFHFLAFHSAWRWSRSGDRSWLLRAALLAGLAASVKLIGLAPLAILGTWILLRRSPAPLQERARCACLTMGLGTAVAFPWLLATWWTTGNPVWPYLSGLFGGADGAAYLADRFTRLNHWPAWTNLEVLLRNGPQYLLIPTLLMTLLNLRDRTKLPPYLRFQAATFLPYALLVCWNYEAWRYCVPWMPALALTTAWGFVRLWKRGGGRAAAAALLLGFAIIPLLRLGQSNALFAVLELRSRSRPDLPPREIFLRQSFPPYALHRAVSRQVGESPARVLLFHESMGYYLDADYLWGVPAFQSLIRYDELTDGGALRVRLRELGITHVIIQVPFPGYYEYRAAALMHQLLAEVGPPITKESGHALYALTPHPARTAP
ncbi:MAG: hypothetical protein ABIJ96_18380 [Elusimicrobiota bacterium]